MGQPQPYRLFGPCAPGVEALLLEEVRAAGGVRPSITPGGVEWEANDHVLSRCLLDLGLALDVRVRLGEFVPEYYDAIVRGAAQLPWGRFVGPGQTMEVKASARKSRLNHTGAIEERVRRGIKECLGSLASSEDEAPWRVFARMEADRLAVSLSLAGEALSRRGYRTAVAKAPLREDLARALLILAGWSSQESFVDPFCGSGTLAIEAARWARRIPPGWDRRFHYQRAPVFDPERWKKVRDQLEARMLPEAPAPILASDRDRGAVEAAQANAERAGVASDLHFEVAPMGRAHSLEAPPSPAGLWLSNPPFGHRAEGGSGLRSLYQAIGNKLRALPKGWRLALIVDDRDLAHATGVDLKSRALLDHGGKKVRVFVSAP